MSDLVQGISTMPIWAVIFIFFFFGYGLNSFRHDMVDFWQGRY